MAIPKCQAQWIRNGKPTPHATAREAKFVALLPEHQQIGDVVIGGKIVDTKEYTLGPVRVPCCAEHAKRIPEFNERGIPWQLLQIM